jgi:transposase
LLANQQEQVLLDKLLEQFIAQGLLKSRGKQRTDSTHVLSSVRRLNRLELVTETVRATLNALVETAPDWLRSWMPLDWVERYARRSEEYRLPNSKAGRDQHALTVGEDGFVLLDAARDSSAPVEVRVHPMIKTLEHIWEQQYERIDGRAKWRSANNFPPAGQRFDSPYDTNARFNSKRGQGWSGYKVHLSETCDDDAPRLVTHVETTPSTITDVDMTQALHERLRDKQLLPDQHIVDTGYLSSAWLVNALEGFDVRLVGPPPTNRSWQARAGRGFDSSAFHIDWAARQVVCPMGRTSVRWHEGKRRGDAFCTASFAFADCFSCRNRVYCTRTVRHPRQLTFLPRDQREALHTARGQVGEAVWQDVYAKRVGIEGTISEAVRCHGLRRSRYRGLRKTALQMLAVGAAVNVVRVVNWLDGLRPVSVRSLPLARLGLVA